MSKIREIILSADVFTAKQNLGKHSYFEELVFNFNKNLPIVAFGWLHLDKT